MSVVSTTTSKASERSKPPQRLHQWRHQCLADSTQLPLGLGQKAFPTRQMPIARTHTSAQYWSYTGAWYPAWPGPRYRHESRHSAGPERSGERPPAIPNYSRERKYLTYTLLL